jgi:5-methylcytosine-specific restriction protein A
MGFVAMSKAQSRWHKLYATEHGRRLARAQITREPLCWACLARGKVEPATCADHITPHAGNVNAFFLSLLQSLCRACHALKTARETRGYSKQIGLDGLPVDPAHPVYGRQNGTIRTGRLIQSDCRV